MTAFSTLCYIRKEHQYLMLHRVVKKNDVNKDKWIGVGGHFEQEESPEECLLREVKEETGYTLLSWKFHGIVTFVSGDGVTEYMFLYTADEFEGTPISCDEGILEWIDIDRIWKLNLWEGDKIFFRLIDEAAPVFSLKLVYDGKGCLQKADLNGRQLELFDILAEDGSRTGLIRERGVAHREGSLHGTVHTWLLRPGKNGKFDVLLQKRSMEKDSNPGCYDISSAGHISAGDVPVKAALRELEEETGVRARPEELQYLGTHRGEHEAVFHGRPFRDREICSVYICMRPVKDEELIPQKSEVESLDWMDLDTAEELVRKNRLPHCIHKEEFDMIKRYLQKEKSRPEHTGKGH